MFLLISDSVSTVTHVTMINKRVQVRYNHYHPQHLSVLGCLIHRNWPPFTPKGSPKNISIWAKTPEYVKYFRTFFNCSIFPLYISSVILEISNTVSDRLVWFAASLVPPEKPYVWMEISVFSYGSHGISSKTKNGIRPIWIDLKKLENWKLNEKRWLPWRRKIRIKNEESENM